MKDIWQFELRRGNSDDPRKGACLLDAVSWIEYGTLGDHPPCACPVIAAYARTVNDLLNDSERQLLRIYIPRLVGSVDRQSEQRRAEYLAWRAIRVFAPTALEAAGLTEEAKSLRKFEGDLWAAAAAADAAAEAAEAAKAAARAATESAVAAAWSAAWSAARAADWAAARAADWAAKAASARAGWAAAAAAVAAAEAPKAASLLIETLNGVLSIGKQAEPIYPEKLTDAQRTFAEAMK